MLFRSASRRADRGPRSAGTHAADTHRNGASVKTRSRYDPSRAGDSGREEAVITRPKLVPLRASALLALSLLLSACRLIDNRDTSQRGYRGTGMQVVYPYKATAHAFQATRLPSVPPPAGESPPGPLPWKNVQVLNDVSVAEFNRTMLSMAEWVAGPGNCQYCHNIANFTSDTANNGKPLYTKLVARSEEHTSELQSH